LADRKYGRRMVESARRQFFADLTNHRRRSELGDAEFYRQVQAEVSANAGF
jgi:hypothetical protein